MEDIVKKLIELIEKENITAYEVAKNTKLSHPAITSILNGKTESPSKKTIEKLKYYIENFGNINGNNNKVRQNFLSEPKTEYKNGELEKLRKENSRLKDELLNCKQEMIDLLKKQ